MKLKLAMFALAYCCFTSLSAMEGDAWAKNLSMALAGNARSAACTLNIYPEKDKKAWFF